MIELKNIKENIINKFSKDFFVYPDSFWIEDNVIYFATKNKEKKYIGTAILEKKDKEKRKDNFYSFKKRFSDPEKIIDTNYKDLKIFLFENTSRNIKSLRNIIKNLNPSPLRNFASFGFGDRLGISTPAHIKALQGFSILPVLAQQSSRELQKTKRNFENVIDSAAWGVFQEGYRQKWGADADHLKELNEFNESADAGFTMFTIDTSNTLIYEKNKSDIYCFKKVINKYLNKKFKINNNVFEFDEDILTKLVIIYGKALSFIKEVFESLQLKRKDFDLEVSFDETSEVTTPHAHYFIAKELHEMQVSFTSLALRFPGEFYKSIEYEGDINNFKESVDIHENICSYFKDYRLSLHSGSDKFSIYPIFAKSTNGNFHIKTSGVSWMCALETISLVKPELIKKIYSISLINLEENLKNYYMNICKDKLPLNLNIFDKNLIEKVIYNKDIRQCLHISYGSVIEKYKKEIFNVLKKNENYFYKIVCEYLKKHLNLLIKK